MTLGSRSPYPEEQEVAVPLFVPFASIISAFPLQKQDKIKMLEKKVTILYNGDHHIANLTYDGNIMKLIFSNQEWISSDIIPFIALLKLRLQLENVNIYILVNGCREDVYPSGMQLNMGLVNAYINVIGKPGGELIDIFEDCIHVELISTVSRQEYFHSKWLASINV